MKNIRQLLTDVLEIINKYEKIAKENGQNFNIFEICDIETAETTICRVIYNLLNPKGSHGQSITYLRAFCNIVLGIEFSDEKLLNASVFREFRILNTNRRIDIVLRIDGQLIPIEAKINAPDQKDQCYDYYTFAKDNSQDKDSLKLYYLTLFGNTPSDESAGALTKIIGSNNVRYEEIQCISFREEITKWLETCVSLPETKSLLPMDVKTLSATIGHISAATTLDIYSHITDTMQKQAAINIDRKIGKSSTISLEQQSTHLQAKNPPVSEFEPFVGKIRKRGTGCVSIINENLYEGRYTPTGADGKRIAKNVYAPTRDECEEKLAELIVQMKSEIAEEKSRRKIEIETA